MVLENSDQPGVAIGPEITAHKEKKPQKHRKNHNRRLRPIRRAKADEGEKVSWRSQTLGDKRVLFVRKGT